MQVNSGYEPAEIDESSSPTTVYVRDNIVKTIMQSESGESIPWWTYNERQYDRQEWDELQMANYVIDLEFRLVLLETQGGII
jgi:hypothetical protein